MEMTCITEILQTVTVSCDFGEVSDYEGETLDDKRTNFWIDVIRVKSGDSGFGHLIDSILEEGFHGSAVGWNECYISEGHHRIVAAILLCLDEIPTLPYGSGGDHPPRAGMSGYFSAHASVTVDTSIEVDF
jgi:hypothetical protein